MNSVSHQSNRGYNLQVDIKYPEHLHDAHSAYPLCPEHLTVEASMISPTLEEMYEFLGGKDVPCDKLISNLRDVLRHPLPLFEILSCARNAARAHAQDRVAVSYTHLTLPTKRIV